MVAFACMNKTIPFFFWVAVASSIFNGISQSFGEAVTLGFLKGFPSGMVGDFSSGTGFSGIFATFSLLGSKAIGMESQTLFFIEIPTIFIWFGSFWWLIQQKKKYRLVPVQEDEPTQNQNQGIPPNPNQEITPSNLVQSVTESTVTYNESSSNTNQYRNENPPSKEVKQPLSMDNEVNDNQRLNLTTIKSLLPRTFYLIFNLFSVYFLEYVIITSFADVIGQKMIRKYPDSDDLKVTEYFTIIQVCYQTGVFFSRSSLRFFKIPGNRVWILTGL